MSYYIVEDSELAKRNKSLIFDSGSNIADNYVLDVLFSGESATEPVTPLEVKQWSRIDVSDDDTIIPELITAARIICEQYTNISFITRTVTARLKNELGGIYLPYGPVNTFVSLTDDEDDTWATADYKIVGGSFKQIKTPFEEMTAVYKTGYTSLPPNLKSALLNQVSWMYDNRGDEQLKDNLSDMAKLILNQVRRVH